MRDVRPQLIEVAAEILHNRTRCLYTESSARWEWHAFPTPHFPFEGDCSSTVTAINYWAKGNDPSDVNFAYGDTTSMMAHAFSKKLLIPKAKLLQGDFIFFGPQHSPDHVVMALQPTSAKSNPLCFSMGKVGDPNVYQLSELLFIGAPTYVRNVTRVK